MVNIFNTNENQTYIVHKTFFDANSSQTYNVLSFTVRLPIYKIIM
jgi:hypothetical protein